MSTIPEVEVPVEQGPSIILAACFETVQQEADGTLSLNRMIDKVVVAADVGTADVVAADQEPPPSAPPLVVSTTLVVRVRTPALDGTSGMLSIQPRTPSGTEASKVDIPVAVEGRSGTNLVIDLDTEVGEEGFYWFDVLLDDQFVTTTPLEIVFQRETVAPDVEA